jgi:very-short-patch-repair endonuclease
MIPYDKNLKFRSRELRKNMTKAESLLWLKIRKQQLSGYIFNRQKIIGDYIIDFYCAKAKLVIEIDGGQHRSNEMVDSDKIRDDFLSSYRLKVLRFANDQVINNIDEVLKNMLANLK